MQRTAKTLIREFTRQDFPAVKEIYQRGIDTGHATFQTRAKDWDEWNQSILPCCRIVSEVNHEVAGWAGLSPVSARRKLERRSQTRYSNSKSHLLLNVESTTGRFLVVT